MNNEDMRFFLRDFLIKHMDDLEKKNPRTRYKIANTLESADSYICNFRKRKVTPRSNTLQDWCEKLGIDWTREIEKERQIRDKEIA